MQIINLIHNPVDIYNYIERLGDIFVCTATYMDPQRLLERKKGICKTRASLHDPFKAGSYSVSSIGTGITNFHGNYSQNNVFTSMLIKILLTQHLNLFQPVGLVCFLPI